MEEPLKQRLVGALVLGTFAIIVVPWMLGEPQVSERSGARPSAPEPAAPEPTPRAPLAQPAPRAVAPAPSAVDSATAQTQPNSTGQSSPRPPSVPPPRPVAVTEAPSASTQPQVNPDLSPWVVQAASFSSEENASRLAERLRGGAFSAVVEQSGRFWRVVLTGFDTRQDADGARARLQLEFGLSGVIQRYP